MVKEQLYGRETWEGIFALTVGMGKLGKLRIVMTGTIRDSHLDASVRIKYHNT